MVKTEDLPATGYWLAFQIGGRQWGDAGCRLYPVFTISWWHPKEADRLCLGRNAWCHLCFGGGKKTGKAGLFWKLRQQQINQRLNFASLAK